MKATFTLQVSGNHLDIEVPQANFHAKAANVIVINSATRAIMAIGETAKSLAQQDPTYWQKVKAKVAFVIPFDATNQDDHFAVLVLEYFGFKVHCLIRSKLRLLYRLFIDRYDYVLTIPHYETLPKEKQYQFEYGVMSCMTRPSSLTINQQKKPIGTYKLLENTFSIIWFSILLGTVIYTRILAFTVTSEIISKQLLDILMLAALLLAVLFAMLVASAVWVLFMKLFMPKPLISFVLTKRLKVPKLVANLLNRLFL